MEKKKEREVLEMSCEELSSIEGNILHLALLDIAAAAFSASVFLLLQQLVELCRVIDGSAISCVGHRTNASLFKEFHDVAVLLLCCTNREGEKGENGRGRREGKKKNGKLKGGCRNTKCNSNHRGEQQCYK